MIEVDPRTRSALWGMIGVVLGAGWIAFAMLGDGNQVFLTVMLILSILLSGVATFVFRVRMPR
jgi:uncharacterized membrane protein HdeD (DUF308 family)